MPYKIEKEGNEFQVINTDSGEVKASHDTKEKAEKQVELLHKLENDKWWDSSDPNGSVESESGH